MKTQKDTNSEQHPSTNMSQVKNHKKSLKVLDLFSGAGGLSLGFEQAGFEVVGGVDSDAKSIETYSYNFSSASAVCADLSEVSARQLAREVDGAHIDVVVGGPPCQGFSVAGKRSESDSRNDLYQHYLKIVRAVQPRAVVIENVPTIRSLYKGRVAEAIESGLSALGYRVTTGILNAAHFGVPQARRRMFFVAMKSDEPRFEFPTPSTSEPLTCWDALSDLPSLSIETGQPVSNYESIPKTEYQRKMRRGSRLLYNHEAVVHKPETIRIISLVPDGGNYKNLPKSLWETRKVNIAWTRMNSKKPSFTIDAGHNHHFHYKHNRVPTVRECARIQSFPDNFRFLGTRTSQYRQVGNAVPPLLAKAIGSEIGKLLT
jgi:DNA (cytosine-5)-methyltransferase 1